MIEIILGAPQKLILGTFYKQKDVCNFADDTTLCKCERDLDIVSEKLQMHANLAINWLNNNEIKTIPKIFKLKRELERKCFLSEKQKTFPTQLGY